MNKKNLLFILVIFAIVLFSCKSPKQTSQTQANQKNEAILAATAYHQQSSEINAICYQNYNLAKMMVDRYLRRAGLTKTAAIITDIDETILDNSPYEAKCILENISYPEQWGEWCEKANAKALPGSLEFFKYAKSKGIEVFYVTNRKEKYKNATVRNLKSLGFPYLDEKHLLFRKESSEKESRRKKIMKDYFVVLLLGDNLNDFSIDFETSESRKREVDKNKDKFGSYFIVFPNSMYGEWSKDLGRSKSRLVKF